MSKIGKGTEDRPCIITGDGDDLVPTSAIIPISSREKIYISHDWQTMAGILQNHKYVHIRYPDINKVFTIRDNEGRLEVELDGGDGKDTIRTHCHIQEGYQSINCETLLKVLGKHESAIVQYPGQPPHTIIKLSHNAIIDHDFANIEKCTFSNDIAKDPLVDYIVSTSE